MNKNIINYVYSKDFIDDLMGEKLSRHSFNALLMVHMLAIAYKTQGIKDIGFVFSYQSTISSSVLVPRMGFYLYTTKNSLIEETNRCSNSLGNFKNDYFSAKNTKEFRQKFIDYFNSLCLSLDQSYNQSSDIIKLSETKARFASNSKKNTASSIDNFYLNVISYNVRLKSQIEKMYLNKVVKIKNVNNVRKNKI